MKGLFNKMLVMVLFGSFCGAQADISFSVNGETIFKTSLPTYVSKVAEKAAKSLLQMLSSTKEAIATEIAPFVNGMKELGQEAWSQQSRLCIGAGAAGICALVVWRKMRASRKSCLKKRKSSVETDTDWHNFNDNQDSF